MSPTVLLIAATALSDPSAAPPESTGNVIRLENVLISLIDQAEIPAREVGVLSEIAVKEGQMVEEGQALAQIDDTAARLDRERAGLEFEIAKQEADSDIKVRLSEKAVEVARAELRRAEESNRQFKKTVSQTELDRLRLTAEKSELEVEQAELDIKTERLNTQLKDVLLKAAEHSVERRKVVSPLDGQVVQIYRREGEWVQPGDTVVRVLQVDRLRAEGFVNASQIRGNMTGSKVTIHVELPGQPGAEFPGELVFVSPEVNPVNGQVRVFAEIENKDLALRPGLQASMTVHVAHGTGDGDQ